VEPGGAFRCAAGKSESAGHALLVATQNVLAAHTASSALATTVSVTADADIDTSPSRAAAAIDINTDPRAPF
jgi:hypothetical protein